APVEAAGELIVRPIFGAARVSPLALVLVAVLVGVGLFLLWPDDDSGLGPSAAEAAYEGVHMCDPATQQQQQQAEDTPSREPRPGEPGFVGPVTGAPFYAQNDPLWGDHEYARA